MHTEKTKIYAAHTPQHHVQHTEHSGYSGHRPDTEQPQHRTRHTALAQPQHRCITYDLHTYSFDLYHEYVAINNSNTIELYTISND